MTHVLHYLERSHLGDRIVYYDEVGILTDDIAQESRGIAHAADGETLVDQGVVQSSQRVRAVSTY